MSLWGNTDTNTDAPKFAVDGGRGSNANGFTTFGNTQISAFVTNSAVGTFGIDSTEAGITTGEAKRAAHAGWNLRRTGVGPITAVTANAGAVGVNATMTITGGGTGNTPATVRVSTNAAGWITGVTVVVPGSYATTPTLNAMSNAAFTITMGGRANRVQYETLVAMGSMTGDGSDDAILPDS